MIYRTKSNIFILLLVLGIACMASCAEDVYEPPVLVLSETDLQFSKAVSEKSITVETNLEKWSAVSNAEWIECTTSGNKLNVKVSENTLTATRHGKIVVLAGGTGKTVEVQQTATSVAVSLPEEITIDQWGGEYLFRIDANTQEWSVSCETEWITIDTWQYRGEVAINVLENKEREARTTKLTFTTGKTVKEVTVTQSGILYYIAPCLKFGIHINEIAKFESARKSLLIKLIDKPTPDNYIFLTASPAFPQITYFVTKHSPLEEYAIATVLSATNAGVMLDPQFETMMKENHFTLKESSFDRVRRLYVSEQEQYDIVAQAIAEDNGAGVIFEMRPKQTRPYPTLEKLMYGYLDFGTSVEQVKKWEAANGGIYNATLSETEYDNFFTFDVNTSPYIHRQYWFSSSAHDNLKEVMYFISDPDLAFFEFAGLYYPTREFMALMKKEGFSYLGSLGSMQVFQNENKGLLFGAAVRGHSMFNNAKPYLQFNFADINILGGSKAIINRMLKNYSGMPASVNMPVADSIPSLYKIGLLPRD